MREFRVTKQYNHFTQKIRVPLGSKTQVSKFTECDSIHKASLAKSQLVLCVTQRGANPKSKTVGAEDATFMLYMRVLTGKGFFHTSSSSVP